MIKNYSQQKNTSLNLRLNEGNHPQAHIELLIQNVSSDKRKKHLVNIKVRALLTLFYINEHDNCLVFYLAGNEPNIKNNKEAIEHWVKAELIERNIDELSMRFKRLLSRIDPTIDLSEF
jgi:hypothetical protein